MPFKWYCISEWLTESDVTDWLRVTSLTDWGWRHWQTTMYAFMYKQACMWNVTWNATPWLRKKVMHKCAASPSFPHPPLPLQRHGYIGCCYTGWELLQVDRQEHHQCTPQCWQANEQDDQQIIKQNHTMKYNDNWTKPLLHTYVPFAYTAG